MAGFSVDTHLFRELGALLVGRDSTALVELVKNAYDADASEVVVWGESLRSGRGGIIRIEDDGTGMAPEQFENGFLRIASRAKDTTDRRSTRWGRRFTGAKGIGRLAAHKLSRSLKVSSVPWSTTPNTDRRSVEAVINWDSIENYETLEKIEQSELDDSGEPKKKDAALSVRSSAVRTSVKCGTRIELRHLRRRWSDAALTRFLAEVQSFQPPASLIKPPPRSVLKTKPLFAEPRVRDSSSRDPSFRVLLEGDFSGGDEYWQALLEAASWIIEIEASPKQPVRVLISPTVRTRDKNKDAETRSYDFAHPNQQLGPFFQARILVREGILNAPKTAQAWVRATTGIRVFMEGFRVLPYGETGNDWLGLDAAYTRRSGELDLKHAAPGEDPVQEEILSVLPNAHYFGAVLLIEDGAKSLEMLVNREGFVPDDTYHALVDIVRTAIDLSTRVRAASSEATRAERRKERQSGRAGRDPTSRDNETATEGGSRNTHGPESPATEATGAAAMAVELTREAKRLAGGGDLAAAVQKFAKAIPLYDEAVSTFQSLRRDEAMLRVLASVGTQMGSFIHEVRGLLGVARAADTALTRIRNDPGLPTSARTQLATVHATLVDLRHSLERHASYLTDILTPDARRRRVRLNIAERFASAVKLVEGSATKRNIGIEPAIPENLKTPPMFPAELTTVFSNLLTNAVKAAGDGGRIRATASIIDQGGVRVLLENTGKRIEPTEGERWFLPFESTTTELDPVLGQGMGLGLPITRGILDQYGAEIHFVAPSSRPFVTALEITFAE